MLKKMYSPCNKIQKYCTYFFLHCFYRFLIEPVSTKILNQISALKKGPKEQEKRMIKPASNYQIAHWRAACRNMPHVLLLLSTSTATLLLLLCLLWPYRDIGRKNWALRYQDSSSCCCVPSAWSITPYSLCSKRNTTGIMLAILVPKWGVTHIPMVCGQITFLLNTVWVWLDEMAANSSGLPQKIW